MHNEQDDGLFTINEHNIQAEYMRIAADIARWNAKLADATRDAQLAEHLLETTQAILDQQLRLVAEADGEKITESSIHAKVKINPDYREKKRAFIEAQRILLHTKGTVQALIVKKDMLVSLGAHIRAELSGEPYLKNKRPQQDNHNWNEET